MEKREQPRFSIVLNARQNPLLVCGQIVISQILRQFRWKVRLDAGRAKIDRFLPCLGVVCVTKAIDIDLRMRVVCTGNDWIFEIVSVKGDHLRLHGPGQELANIRTDCLGHNPQGWANLVNFIQEEWISVDYDVILHIVIHDGINQLLRIGILGVHIDVDLSMGQVERLIESRHLGSCKCTGELCAGIERSNLVEGMLVHFARPIRCAVQGTVVHDHKLAVQSGSNVQFEIVSMSIDSSLKCNQCVFWMMKVLAAMCYDFDPLAIFKRRPGGLG
jgi:hypothetical protein